MPSSAETPAAPEETRGPPPEIAAADGLPTPLALRSLFIGVGTLLLLPRQIASALMAYLIAGAFHLHAKRQGLLPEERPEPESDGAEKAPPEAAPGADEVSRDEGDNQRAL